MTDHSRITNAAEVSNTINHSGRTHARIQVLGSLASFITMAGSMAIMISLTLV
ncbi:MAG: hypothetical protein AAGI30_07035 [Planctomycetota bacterium]